MLVCWARAGYLFYYVSPGGFAPSSLTSVKQAPHPSLK